MPPEFHALTYIQDGTIMSGESRRIHCAQCTMNSITFLSFCLFPARIDVNHLYNMPYSHPESHRRLYLQTTFTVSARHH